MGTGVVLDIDEMIDALMNVGLMIIRIYKECFFKINGHQYNGFVVLIGILLVFYLLYYIWGGDDEE